MRACAAPPPPPPVLVDVVAHATENPRAMTTIPVRIRMCGSFPVRDTQDGGHVIPWRPDGCWFTGWRRAGPRRDSPPPDRHAGRGYGWHRGRAAAPGPLRDMDPGGAARPARPRPRCGPVAT